MNTEMENMNEKKVNKKNCKKRSVRLYFQFKYWTVEIQMQTTDVWCSVQDPKIVENGHDMLWIICVDFFVKHYERY